MNSLYLSFNIFRTSFKLENDYFDAIFFPWCFDVTFKFHNSVLNQMLISLQLYKIAENQMFCQEYRFSHDSVHMFSRQHTHAIKMLTKQIRIL